ncbi:hypothetical protein HCH52_04135 [Oscillospiraceae bacterium HV4-5-C5C]|nr:hypothetical protein [Oscillospiraceae bacterium HV4-5-C5C]
MKNAAIDPLYRGYQVLETCRLQDIDCDAALLEHSASGARIMALINDDDNRVFGIGFKTPPENDYGAPHIIEHSVLSGSRHYQTKEPFMDLYKGSLQTFLNAMTYPDKTLFPVASRNLKDFHQLSDVYLDAVFYPAIYDNPLIFAQEGWHYDLSDPDGPLTRSGVVLNEMKGAYADPMTVLSYEVNRQLFAGTPYAYESGGHPDAIPQLDYQSFLDFHRRHYHPSNSWICLYGRLDLAAELERLDQTCLGAFDRLPETLKPRLPLAEPFTQPRQAAATYPLPEGQDPQGKNWLAYACVYGSFNNRKENLMLEILSDVLISGPGAPLRRALLDAGLGEDVRVIDDNLQQNLLGLVLVNSGETDVSRFQTVIESALEKSLADGLNLAELEGALNRVEYDLRECEDMPTRGLLYYVWAMDAWLYGGSPWQNLSYSQVLAELRQDIRSGAPDFHRLARQAYLDNPHRLTLLMEGKPGLGQEKEQQTARSLADTLSQWPEAKRQQILAETRRLNAWQETPDRPEQLATIPRLTLQDVPARLSPWAREERCQLPGLPDGVLLRESEFTAGIRYLQIVFKLNHMSAEDFSPLAFLASCLGKLSTRRLSYAELDTEIYLKTGGLQVSLSLSRSFASKDDLWLPAKASLPVQLLLTVSGKATEDQVKAWGDLLVEILTDSRLDETERLKELLLKQKNRLEQQIIQYGSAFAALRASAGIRPDSRLKDRLNGLAYYDWICRTLKRLPGETAELTHELAELYRRLISPAGITAAIGAEAGAQPQLQLQLSEWLQRLLARRSPARGTDRQTEQEQAAARPHNLAEPGDPWVVSPPARQEGIMTSAEVQFIARAFDLEAAGSQGYNGFYGVLAHYISLELLHPQIRAMGGAYGTDMSLQRSGIGLLTTYRDPNLQRTLDIFKSLPDWLRQHIPDEAALLPFIIGSVNQFDPPLTPSGKAETALSLYLSGLSRADIEQALAQALASGPASFTGWPDLLDQALQAPTHICVIGNMATLTALPQDTLTLRQLEPDPLV